MPHDEPFIRGGHAPQAAFERKDETCYKCHTHAECQSCHVGFPGHLTGWKEEHKKMPRQGGCSCHSIERDPATESMCDLCH
jgi:hypothetical protein